MRSGARLLLSILVLLVVGCSENEIVAPELLGDAAEQALYFPGRDEWARREPAEAGFDPERLERAILYARNHEADVPTDLRAWLEERLPEGPEQRIVGPLRDRAGMNGLILREGYLVAEWGDTEQVDMAFSVTKSFLAAVAGVAVREDRIRDLGAPVGDLVRDGGYDSAQNAPITWEMSLRQTSEWEGTLFDKPDTADRREGADRQLQAPGTFWEYNDVRVNRLALSLLRVFEQPLPDVLEREIMGPIGASRSWRWHGYRTSQVEVAGAEVQSVSGGGHWGGGLWIDSRDLARFGLLHLREGLWRERQLLPADWVERSTSPGELNPTYGYLWWVNTGGGLWPSLPEEAYAARGGGDHVLLVVPSRELVVVARWIDRDSADEFFGLVLEALRDSAQD